MPKKELIDKEKIQTELRTYLKRHGATPAKLLCEKFKISQPTLSRIFTSIKENILFIGKAKETKYALTRKIENTQTPIPIYEILDTGTSRIFGVLQAIEPQGFYFESKILEAKSSLYPDLPYFLNDLRPSGFLGRLIPAQNKDLNLPEDINRWTADNCLNFLSSREWNAIGNFILGEKSFQLYLENCQAVKHFIKTNQRIKQYPLYANDILTFADAGSSAGGDQAKFTTILLPSQEHVIVKFSPPTNTEIGERIADLLICEHLALQTLNKNSQIAAKSEILNYENRTFLEIERFDRTMQSGRRGLISLGSLDAEYTGILGTWRETAAALVKNKIISHFLLEKIRWLELFGAFIANNDMHLYNLSFFTEGLRVVDLAPTYDMLPMLFMPRHHQIIPIQFIPPTLHPEDGKIFSSVYQAVCDFWNSVIEDKRISRAFKKIALDCKNKVTELEKIAKKLPRN